jgi:hypothetical protein
MNNPILEVAIGISFVYLLLALMSSTANEMIAGWLNTRAKTLEEGIARMLKDPDLMAKVYQHPLIRSLGKTDKDIPSYIPSDKFALALMDVVTGPGKVANDEAALMAGAKAIGGHFGEVLTAVLQDEHAGRLRAQQRIEAWFDQSMDRVSGWYKRKSQINNLILAAAITLLMNADTIKISRRLWVDPTTRAVFVEQAKARTQAAVPAVDYSDPDNPDSGGPVKVDEHPISQQERAVIQDITGWNEDFGERDRISKAGTEGTPGTAQSATDWTAVYPRWLLWLLKEHLLGWILSTLAISLGAPFWFDTLNRFMRVRNAGVTPQEAAETKAKTETPQ